MDLNASGLPTCQACDDADATHVILADLGDLGGEAAAGYRMACPTCSTRGYMDALPLTAEWLRWFDAPWTTPPNERGI